MEILELVRVFAIALLAGLACLLAMIAVVALVALTQHWTYVRKRRNAPARSSDEAPRIKARMSRLARPTLLLTPATESGFSKLGGNPELPAGFDWPADGRRPRTFIAQIDLADVRNHDGPEWLPPAGRLYAFVDEARYGFADLVRIVSTDEPSGWAAEPPARVEKREDRRLASSFVERRIAFAKHRSVPSLDWLGVDLTEIDLGDEELDELADAPDAPFGEAPQHRIGGYPSEIQDEQMAISCELMRRGLPTEYGETEITPAIERASKQWRMLLQIDSDPELKMNWGDGGRLYVFIREKDALKGDFSQTVTISQSY
ncbi:MAG: DUF1963 domain-containing protein [Alphaproteobacteria bacterium]|nr:DUF1963 domain-containing protein [Alphaproteobacteria bacterium]MBU1516002.1 DUF1963 domain-containing protein [Alphaproteobacteria bacterium]MBU2092783.1 DUF1963 domain-containing protein [Alphaproteobacteria bacterium]MBU2153692.1 DUF1963 domain-containing protein [Alphaproteobacteria bacterium]MBU2308320.1 DUF1963 domain-containing protein [Alphaproteobacteria bacterium]